MGSFNEDAASADVLMYVTQKFRGSNYGAGQAFRANGRTLDGGYCPYPARDLINLTRDTA